MFFSCCCPKPRAKPPVKKTKPNAKQKPKTKTTLPPIITNVCITEDERMSEFTEPRQSMVRSSVSSSDETVSFSLLDNQHNYEKMRMEKRETNSESVRAEEEGLKILNPDDACDDENVTEAECPVQDMGQDTILLNEPEMEPAESAAEPEEPAEAAAAEPEEPTETPVAEPEEPAETPAAEDTTINE